jgi:hypothetical protein
MDMENFSSNLEGKKNGTYRITARSAIVDGIMFLCFIGAVIVIPVGLMEEPISWFVTLAGVAGIVVGVLLLTAVKVRKTVAELCSEGIREYASKASKGLIRWEEIESVTLYETTLGTNDLSAAKKSLVTGKPAQNDVFVGINLVDAEAYMKRLNVIQKGIMKLALNTGHAPINIPTNVLEGKEAELVELCNDFLKKKPTEGQR